MHFLKNFFEKSQKKFAFAANLHIQLFQDVRFLLRIIILNPRFSRDLIVDGLLRSLMEQSEKKTIKEAPTNKNQ